MLTPIFVEVADRCWTARLDWYDVNVSIVQGEAGLAVIDTASEALANTLLPSLRSLTSAPILAVINTHHHFDHVQGNVVFSAAGADVICHEDAAASKPSLSATRTLSSAHALDLGDRLLEVLHPGKGHTSGDVVIRVPDADVMFAGDLVEESTARNAVPGFGDDCWPMDWPRSMDLVLGLLTPGSVVVPGHGAPVDLDFVQEQRVALGVVAETIRDLAGRGIPVSEALEHGDWPYPREELAAAVRRGYEQLPRHAKGLPLI